MSHIALAYHIVGNRLLWIYRLAQTLLQLVLALDRNRQYSASSSFMIVTLDEVFHEQLALMVWMVLIDQLRFLSGWGLVLDVDFSLFLRMVTTFIVLRVSDIGIPVHYI